MDKQRKYHQSASFKASVKKYNQSPKGRAKRRKYETSKHGKAMKAIANRKYRNKCKKLRRAK